MRRIIPREGQVQLLIWMDEEKKQHFKRVTGTLDTTMTAVIIAYVEEWMEENEKKYKQVKAVLAE